MMTIETERPTVGDVTRRDAVIVPAVSFGAPGFEPWEVEFDAVLPVDTAERLTPLADERSAA